MRKQVLGLAMAAALALPAKAADITIAVGGAFTSMDPHFFDLSPNHALTWHVFDRLVHPDLNHGLPPFLTPDAGVNSGFMMAQVTAAALASECKVLSHPASVDTIPTDGSKEDVVPMAMGAAWKARRVLRNLENILAIELMCGAQGIDFRAPLRPGRGVRTAHERVRDIVPRLEADRVLSGDIAALMAAVSAGQFADIGSVI